MKADLVKPVKKMNLEKAIARCMKDFDFNKVYAAMSTVKWVYFDGPPTLERIKECALSLLRDLGKQDYVMCSTGGFVATLDVENNCVKLSFELESSYGLLS